MAIPHANPGEMINIAPYRDRLAEQQTRSLFKSKQVEVLRLVLPAGKTIAEHRAPGEITVQCLEGRIEFTTMGKTVELREGQMLFLTASEPHALKSLEDASVLVTIAIAPAR